MDYAAAALMTIYYYAAITPRRHYATPLRRYPLIFTRRCLIADDEMIEMIAGLILSRYYYFQRIDIYFSLIICFTIITITPPS